MKASQEMKIVQKLGLEKVEVLSTSECRHNDERRSMTEDHYVDEVDRKDDEGPSLL